MIIKGSLNNEILKLPPTSANKIIKGYQTFVIIGGEFAITSDVHNIALQTLLGSCVAVAIYDRYLRIKGLNHFLLPDSKSKADSYRFGLYSLEEMLNEMYRMGAKRDNLIAKIAGGANVLGYDVSNIGQKNVDFAKEFCEKEKIKIISEHTLGYQGRVILLGNNFETFIRTVDNKIIDEKILKEEQKLLNSAKEKATVSDITFF